MDEMLFVLISQETMKCVDEVRWYFYDS